MKSPKRARIVLLADLEEHSAREVCLGAAQYAAKSNLSFEPWSSAGDDPPKPSEFSGIDGLLLTAVAARKIFGTKPRIKIPHVYVLNASLTAKAPCVTLEEGAIGKMAAEHLINRGYQNLVSMTSSQRDWSQLRVEGFRQECRRGGVQVKHYQLAADILPVDWQRHSLGKNQHLRDIVDHLPKPTGIFTVNDVAACFLIETARHCGVRVPQEIGVIGADDDLIPNAAAGLSISSIEPPFRTLGWQAAAVVDQLRQGRKPSLLTTLPPVRVIVRASTNAFMVSNQLLQRAQTYIEEHRREGAPVTAVAKAVGTTTVTLGKHFREHLNISPSEYILWRRIEYAKELLREGKLNVEEVSDTCGFHSCSYFCHVFKQITSATPGSFRP
jgi:LacI family transcriptional regulator